MSIKSETAEKSVKSVKAVSSSESVFKANESLKKAVGKRDELTHSHYVYALQDGLTAIEGWKINRKGLDQAKVGDACLLMINETGGNIPVIGYITRIAKSGTWVKYSKTQSGNISRLCCILIHTWSQPTQ